MNWVFFFFKYNYKTSDFNVIYHSVVWYFENVLAGVIWAFQNLQVDRSWVTVYRSGIFLLCIPCHSRHRVYLQCHCQLKLKTGGRCNDIERRANIISFSSMTHTDNRFLLWGLPKNNKTMYQQRLGSKKSSVTFFVPHILNKCPFCFLFCFVFRLKKPTNPKHTVKIGKENRNCITIYNL